MDVCVCVCGHSYRLCDSSDFILRLWSWFGLYNEEAAEPRTFGDVKLLLHLFFSSILCNEKLPGLRFACCSRCVIWLQYYSTSYLFPVPQEIFTRGHSCVVVLTSCFDRKVTQENTQKESNGEKLCVCSAHRVILDKHGACLFPSSHDGLRIVLHFVHFNSTGQPKIFILSSTLFFKKKSSDEFTLLKLILN